MSHHPTALTTKIILAVSGVWIRLHGRSCLASLAFILSACSSAHYVVNAPLEQDRSVSGYAMRNLAAPGNTDSLVVVLTLSGGGYRAAAMAFATLEVLDKTSFYWDGSRRNLLQEVDLISAVSGGSLAAAYYGLHPDTFFKDFRPRVLDYDMQADVLARAVSPRGVWRQTSPTFGRGDLLQDALDERVFNNLTFASMQRRRPLVYVNATDFSSGDRFEFTQDQFDHLCSDLNRFPVARAVAASMAVPILMSPVTLWNHKRRCPMLVPTHPVHGSFSLSNYIHLVDGGISDNTGVRTALDVATADGGLVPAMRRAGFRGVRRLVQIIVDAQLNPIPVDDDSPRTPGMLRQLRSAFDVSIERRSKSTFEVLEQRMQTWKQEVHAASQGLVANDVAIPDMDFQVIRIGLTDPNDTSAAEQVKLIPTGLRIRPEQVETVRKFVRAELAASIAWQRMLSSLRDDEPAWGKVPELALVPAPGEKSQP